MKTILTIMKKEFARVFTDRRMIFSMFILPGLMIFVLYSLMGKIINEDEEVSTYDIVIINDSVDNSLNSYIMSFENDDVKYNIITDIDYDEGYNRIVDEKLECMIVLDHNFDDIVKSDETSKINVYYNPSKSSSDRCNTIIEGILSSYNMKITGNIDAFNMISNEAIDEDKAYGEGFAMLLPFIIIVFLFSSVMSVTPESIAGEKERGTIATMLVTPASRTGIALGKVFSLSVLSVLGALSSFIGTIASMPSLMGGGSTSMYHFGDYVSILFILIASVILIVSVMALISSFAKGIKEATMLAMPLLGICMVVGVISMMGTLNNNGLFSLIPLYNTVMCLADIFRFEGSLSSILITIISNLVYSSMFIVLLTRNFNNEKLMFN